MIFSSIKSCVFIVFFRGFIFALQVTTTEINLKVSLHKEVHSLGFFSIHSLLNAYSSFVNFLFENS
jgi:hypothetical protein